MKIVCQNVPLDALSVIADQLREFGVKVWFYNAYSGTGLSEAGQFTFCLWASELTVTVTEDKGHFPKALLIGGIRQLVEEAAAFVSASPPIPASTEANGSTGRDL
jgi:hypothetical protein